MKCEKRVLAVVASIALLYVVPELARGDTRHALIVATETYEKAGRLLPLPGTNESAERIADAFVSGGYLREHVTLIRNGSSNNRVKTSTGGPPTHTNVIGRIAALAGQVQPKDTVVVVLIGHGRELAGKSYYCPTDASDASLDDPALAEKELVSIPAITDQLVKSKAANKLLVVDACRDSSLTSPQFVQNLEAVPTGVCIMTSCSRGQSSWISSQISESELKPIFSHFLCEGIRGDADLLGSNDGEITIHELFSYTCIKTQEAAARIGQSQSPELFTGTGRSFTVGWIMNNTLTRMLITSNPVLEGRQNAALLADIGLQHVRDGEKSFNFAFQQLKHLPSEQIKAGDLLQPIYRKHHTNLCFTLGTYLSPALEFNAECRDAHLARGFIYRACGMYREALNEYESGGEHFDLFVKGDAKEIERFVAHVDGTMLTNQRGESVLNVTETKLSDHVRSLKEVSLLAEPSVTGVAVQPVSRDAKVRIDRVETIDDKEWLHVVAVGDKRLERPGWLPREQALWFPEATAIYLPESLMNKKVGDLGGGPAKLIRDQIRMRKIARRAQAVQKIENFERRYDEKMEGYNRARRIPFVSSYLPNIDGYVKPYTGMAKTYASIPNGYVRSDDGYAQLSESDAIMAAEIAKDGRTYYDGLKRALLFSGKNLDRAVEQRLIVEDSPWKDRRAVANK